MAEERLIPDELLGYESSRGEAARAVRQPKGLTGVEE